MMCKSAYSLRLHVLFSWKPLWIVEKLVKLRYQRNYKHTKKSLIHTTNSYLNVMCVWFWVNHCKDLRKTLWCISVGWTLYLNSMYILKSPIRRVEKKKKKRENTFDPPDEICRHTIVVPLQCIKSACCDLLPLSQGTSGFACSLAVVISNLSFKCVLISCIFMLN